MRYNQSEDAAVWEDRNMAGARHKTDEDIGESDTPYSYGPNPSLLIDQIDSHRVDGDACKSKTSKEPKPGKELDFN